MAGSPPPRDVLLAVAVAVAGVLEALLVDGVPARPVAAIAAVLSAAALAWRRTAPLAAAGIVAVGLLAGPALLGTRLDATVVPLIVVLLAAYSAGAFGPRRTARIGLVVLLAGAAVSVLAQTGPEAADLAFAAVLVGAAWAAGAGHRVRAAYAEVLEDRAAALERERELRAAEAVAAERLRIARELHDVVTHALSVMTLQAGGVRRLLPAEAGREKEALRAVEHTGRQAMTEMARMLGVLRAGAGSAPREPQPGLDRLGELAERISASGVPTHLRVEGEPYEVPPSVELSAYRIAQEALTNVLKHAGARRADLLLRYRPGELYVEITDDGRGASWCGTGHGIVGMRERAAVFGGTLEAAPGPGGGFRVEARIPVGASK